MKQDEVETVAGLMDTAIPRKSRVLTERHWPWTRPEKGQQKSTGKAPQGHQTSKPRVFQKGGAPHKGNQTSDTFAFQEGGVMAPAQHGENATNKIA